MDMETRVGRLCGCYVTIPTMFRDGDLALDLPAVRRHVKFLLDGGIETGNAVLLAGGAAGDFSTMSFDERVALTDAVVQEVEGRVPVILGAQTTSTAELVELTRAAERVGAEYVQVSPPYYFAATEGDFYEYIVAASEAADIGIIIYNTFWTSSNVSLDMVDRLTDMPNVVGLKWSTPGLAYMAFERAVVRYAGRLSVIDNRLTYVTSHMMGRSGESSCIRRTTGRSGASRRGSCWRPASTPRRRGSWCAWSSHSTRCGKRWVPIPAETATWTSSAWS